MIRNINERFLFNNLKVLDAFPVCDLDKVAIDNLSDEFTVCFNSEVEIFCEYYFGTDDENRNEFPKEWDNLKFEIIS